MFDLSTIGVFVYLIYPIIVIAISLYVSFTREMTSINFFFANRNTHWFILGISLITSSLFSPYIFGFTSAGLSSGLPYIYGIISVIMLAILGWSLSPKYLKTNISTLPEYFEKRFNKSCKFFVSGLYIFSNLFLRLLIILIAGNIFFHMITGIDAYFSLLFFLVVTGIYLIIGGLSAELYVNVIQVLFIVIGGLGILIWFLYQGNYSIIEANKVNITAIIEVSANSSFTLIELLCGLPIIGFWFLCADQFIVQKLLSVRDINYARKATLVSAFAQLIPVSIFILPGIIASAFFPYVNSTDIATFLFNEGLMPNVLKGGLLIAVIAALMTSFSSVLNSTTMLFVYDFYRSFKPETSDRKLVLIGRLTIMTILFFAFLLLPVSQSLDFEFCMKLFSVFSSIIAMVAAVLLIGLINQKINSKSAVTTLVAGTIVIIFKSVFEIFFEHNSISILLTWFTSLNLLQFSIFMFIFSVISLFVFNLINIRYSFITHFSQLIIDAIVKIKYKHKIHKKDFLVFTVLIITAVCWIIYKTI